MMCKICGVNDWCLLSGGRFGRIAGHVYLKVGRINCEREPEMSCYRDTSS